MIRVGITGQAGFVGTHLFHFLKLDRERFELVPFRDEIFGDPDRLKEWVKRCDTIVHLAAMNRHNNPDEIYRVNTGLVRQLIGAMEAAGVAPHVLFSSSTQEAFDNPYGQSKREGREQLMEWSARSGSLFTGLVIPNVFGPFGHPYYNSVVATFAHQLTHGETPRVEVDKQMRLIYVGELSAVIGECIWKGTADPEFHVSHTSECGVSEILRLLERYRDDYAGQGMIPELKNTFERNLFNTFRCYMDIADYFPVHLEEHSDERGSFVETMRLGIGGQVSFSTTRPGVTRGNHFHTRKIERFVVIRGKAVIRLRRIGTDQVLEFHLDGTKPSYVDMPVWYTHNITNVGDEELYTLFWINEFYDPSDPDTFYENV